MKPFFFVYSLYSSTLVLFTTILSQANPALSQITPDNTLGAESSTVNPRDANSESIEGGAIRGQNLFHSFQEFNVGADRGVYFANPDAVSNIFSRVTGNSQSNILGTLGVDGAANLYLINPNGIVFGQQSSLDVQGSFTATTADAIEFGEGGLFSAVAPGESLLTINVPLGLQFGSSPDSIVNRSRVQDGLGINIGLQVPDKENLTLVGGEIFFDGGKATARGGNIEIAAIGEKGIVNLDKNGSLNLQENLDLADVNLNNAVIDATGGIGGNITFNAKNLNLKAEEELGEFSLIISGTRFDLVSAVTQPGDITINTTNNTKVDNSTIRNSASFNNKNDSGDININTGKLALLNGGQIAVSNSEGGNAGNINIVATEEIAFFAPSRVATGNNTFFINTSSIESRASDSKNAGGINISTNNLIMNRYGRIQVSADSDSNVGAIDISANNITLDNQSLIASFSGAGNGGGGESEGINISTANLSLINESEIVTNNLGTGGDAGNINITAREDIIFDSLGRIAVIYQAINNIAINEVFETQEELGTLGNLTILANNLFFSNGGKIESQFIGNIENTNINNINIAARENVIINGKPPNNTVNFFTGIRNAGIATGNITLYATNLTLTDGGSITASTFGFGNAGKINIFVDKDIVINGSQLISIMKNKDSFNFTISYGNSDALNSGIYSQVTSGASGNSNGIDINAGSLALTNGGVISASSSGQGDAGKINITVIEDIVIDGQNSINIFGSEDLVSVSPDTSTFTILTETYNYFLFSGIYSQVDSEASGNSEGIEINAKLLNLTNKGAINATTFGEGNAGKLKLNFDFLNLNKDASISSRSESNFGAGDITLNIANTLQAINSQISTSSTQSSGGNLTITAGDIKLRGNSDITTNISSGEGSGGNISIKANSILAFDDSDIFAFAPEGQGGNITFDTPAFFAENFTLNSLTAENTELIEDNNRADVNATGAVSSGSVSIPDVGFVQNSLTELPDNSINTDELVANSCVVPVGNRSQGKFVITGGESLPVHPGNNLPSKYPTGEVRSVPEDNNSGWQPGDPIIEPQGAYRLANGKLVLSRECSE